MSTISVLYSAGLRSRRGSWLATKSVASCCTKLQLMQLFLMQIIRRRMTPVLPNVSSFHVCRHLVAVPLFSLRKICRMMAAAVKSVNRIRFVFCTVWFGSSWAQA